MYNLGGLNIKYKVSEVICKTNLDIGFGEETSCSTSIGAFPPAFPDILQQNPTDFS